MLPIILPAETVSELFEEVKGKEGAQFEVDLDKQTINFNSTLRIIGNIPIIGKLTQIADPLSMLVKFKIFGDWNNPEWDLVLDPLNLD